MDIISTHKSERLPDGSLKLTTTSKIGQRTTVSSLTCRPLRHGLFELDVGMTSTNAAADVALIVLDGSQAKALVGAIQKS